MGRWWVVVIAAVGCGAQGGPGAEVEATGSAEEGGYCTGDSDNCSWYDWPSDCGHQSGCAWDWTDEECHGTADDCYLEPDFQESQDACEEQMGCWWELGEPS